MLCAPCDNDAKVWRNAHSQHSGSSVPLSMLEALVYFCYPGICSSKYAENTSFCKKLWPRGKSFSLPRSRYFHNIFKLLHFIISWYFFFLIVPGYEKIIVTKQRKRFKVFSGQKFWKYLKSRNCKISGISLFAFLFNKNVFWDRRFSFSAGSLTLSVRENSPGQHDFEEACYGT